MCILFLPLAASVTLAICIRHFYRTCSEFNTVVKHQVLYDMLICISACRKPPPARWGLHYDVKARCDCVVVAVSSKHFALCGECGDSEVVKLKLKKWQVLLLMNFILLGFFCLVLFCFKWQPLLFPIKALNSCCKQWHYMEDPTSHQPCPMCIHNSRVNCFPFVSVGKAENESISSRTFIQID